MTQASGSSCLRSEPRVEPRQLAAELGVSLGGVNYALKALVERGFVEPTIFVSRATRSRICMY